MIKKMIKSMSDYFGFLVVRKIQASFKIGKEKQSRGIDPKIVREIFEFFDSVPPFYDPSVRDELKIMGAWGKI